MEFLEMLKVVPQCVVCVIDTGIFLFHNFLRSRYCSIMSSTSSLTIIPFVTMCLFHEDIDEYLEGFPISNITVRKSFSYLVRIAKTKQLPRQKIHVQATKVKQLQHLNTYKMTNDFVFLVFSNLLLLALGSGRSQP